MHLQGLVTNFGYLKNLAFTFALNAWFGCIGYYAFTWIHCTGYDASNSGGGVFGFCNCLLFCGSILCGFGTAFMDRHVNMTCMGNNSDCCYTHGQHLEQLLLHLWIAMCVGSNSYCYTYGQHLEHLFVHLWIVVYMGSHQDCHSHGQHFLCVYLWMVMTYVHGQQSRLSYAWAAFFLICHEFTDCGARAQRSCTMVWAQQFMNGAAGIFISCDRLISNQLTQE